MNSAVLSLLPAAVAGVGALLVLLVDLVMPRSQVWQRPLGVVILLAATATVPVAWTIGWFAHTDRSGLPEILASIGVPSPARVLQVVALLGAAAALILLGNEHREAPGGLSVAVALVLVSAAGAASAAASVDVISLVVSLEVATLPAVALVALRGRRGAVHASLSLLMTSLVSFAVTVLGAALYLAANSSVVLSAELVGAGLDARTTRPALLLGTVLLVVGMAFKLSLVPFHAWTPQAYREGDLGVVALLVTTSKAAGVGGILAVLRPLIDPPAPFVLAERGLVLALAVLAVASMLIGAVGALRQTRPLGLLAWSTIGQAGWVLLPLTALTDAGRSAAVGYFLAYALATLVLLAVLRRGRALPAQHLSDGPEPAFSGFLGYVRRDRIGGAALVFALLVLAGLPPGVYGLLVKVGVLAALTAEGLWVLAVIAVVGVVLGIAAYARWLAAALGRVPERGTEAAAAGRTAYGALLVLGAGCLVLIVLSVWPALVAPFLH